MKRARSLVGLSAAAYALVAVGALTLPGCGEDAEIKEKPVQDGMKDSMDYMQKKYSSKKGGSPKS